MEKIVLLITLFFLFKCFSFFKKKGKHYYNVKTGNKILDKLNTFNYPGQKLNYLRKIDPFVFEELLLTSFQKKGYKIKRNKKYTGDGGIDGIVYNNKGLKILIQAKRYSKYINPDHVKEFNKLVSKNNCKGYFIHTGKTGPKSKELCSDNIKIISGSGLLNIIN